MDIRKAVTGFGEFIDNEEMSGRQAAVIIGGFLGGIILMGLVAFLMVFIILGF